LNVTPLPWHGHGVKTSGGWKCEITIKIYVHYEKVILYKAETRTCAKREESKLHTVNEVPEGRNGKIQERELERYTLGESSKWRIHRTKLRDVD
jgi:hypothetical protein